MIIFSLQPPLGGDVELTAYCCNSDRPLVVAAGTETVVLLCLCRGFGALYHFNRFSSDFASSLSLSNCYEPPSAQLKPPIHTYFGLSLIQEGVVLSYDPLAAERSHSGGPNA